MSANKQRKRPLRASERQAAKDAILDAMRRGMPMSAAARIANVTRQAVFKWRKACDEFDRLCEEAYEEGTEFLEAIAIQRAVQGVKKPVFWQGQQVGAVVEYSDTLLMQQLNARNPAKYRAHHKVEHSGGIRVVIEPQDAAL